MPKSPKTNPYFELHFSNKIQTINPTDFPNIVALKEDINGILKKIRKLTNKNPKAFEGRSSRFSPYKSELDKLHGLTKQLQNKEWELEYSLSHSGGTSQNFDKILQDVKASKVPFATQIDMLMNGIAAKRTPTRFSFTVIKGHQGPHTVARILGISIRQGIFVKYANTLTIKNIQDVYTLNILAPNRIEADYKSYPDYVDKYKDTFEAFHTTTDLLEKIALGQMLTDLHPFATTFKIPTRAELGGKNEAHNLMLWWQTNQDVYLDLLIDYLSIKNQVSPYKEQCFIYADQIKRYYKYLRKTFLS